MTTESKRRYSTKTGAAHQSVIRAVRDGRLMRRPCEDCGSTDRVQAHHHKGYSSENALDVVWLCKSHHRRRHAAENATDDSGMTIPDAARMLGVAPSTLRLQARLGKLKATRAGRDWWVEPAEVERYRRDHLRKKEVPA